MPEAVIQKVWIVRIIQASAYVDRAVSSLDRLNIVNHGSRVYEAIFFYSTPDTVNEDTSGFNEGFVLPRLKLPDNLAYS